MKRSVFVVTLLCLLGLMGSLVAEESPRLGINTDGWEDGVTVSQDGKTVYFIYKPYDPAFLEAGYQKKGPERPKNHGNNFDIYRALRQADGNWGEPEAVVELNSMKDEFSPSLTSDGKVMYLVRDVAMSQTVLFFSMLTNQVWSAPSLLPAPYNSSFGEESPYQAYNDSAFIFASRRIRFTTPWLLWISYRDEQGILGMPEKMPVNSIYNDWQATTDPSSGDLYFISDRDGDADIYVARNTGSRCWGKPEKIKKDWQADVISSPCFDGTGKHLYFSYALAGETGFIDIYVSTLQADNSWGKPVSIDNFKP